MTKTKIALVVVGLLALAGGGTALANQGTTTSHRSGTPNAAVPAAAFHGPMHGRPGGPGGRVGGDLQVAATYLGTTPAALMTQLQSGKTLAQIANATTGKSADGLIAKLVAVENTEIANAVKAGKLTQAQADTITANLMKRVTNLVSGVRPAGPGPAPAGPGFGHGPAAGLLNPAATYLGISVQSIVTQLQAGKTLAQIANATTGKSAAKLIGALVADAQKRFGANVPADLMQRITDFVNGVRPSGSPSHGLRRPGFHA